MTTTATRLPEYGAPRYVRRKVRMYAMQPVWLIAEHGGNAFIMDSNGDYNIVATAVLTVPDRDLQDSAARRLWALRIANSRLARLNRQAAELRDSMAATAAAPLLPTTAARF